MKKITKQRHYGHKVKNLFARKTGLITPNCVHYTIQDINVLCGFFFIFLGIFCRTLALVHYHNFGIWRNVDLLKK